MAVLAMVRARTASQRACCRCHGVVIAAAGMRDAKPVSETPHQGPAFTFEGFEALNRDDARRIDYIFVPEGARVMRHAHDATRIGRWYPSDHLPVIAVVIFD